MIVPISCRLAAAGFNVAKIERREIEMVVQGERVGFIGKALLFKTAADWNKFEKQFRDGILKRREQVRKRPTDVWPAEVTIDRLDSAGMAQFARERGSQPYAGYAVAFLNHSAIRACELLGIRWLDSGIENPVRPEYVETIVQEEFLFDLPIAGAPRTRR